LDSHVRSRVNLPTERLESPRAGGVDLRQAYAFARGVARMHGRRHENAPGHTLVAVRGASFATTLLETSDDAFAVVGRHTQCGIVMMEDPSVALRHVLVRSLALPAGGLALRVFDLHTGAGFLLPDGSCRTSILAEGPVAIAIGEYALVALPTESRGDELPGELPPPIVATPPAVREQLEALASAMSPYRANARPLNRVSRITLMPSLVMVGEPMSPSLGRLANGGAYALTLSRAGRSATVTLSSEDLVRGVVIGRSEKCHSEDLRRITGEGTSRTHVLLLREGAIVSAYDLASTQGTYHAGSPARRVVLSDAGTELGLGRAADGVRLFFQARY